MPDNIDHGPLLDTHQNKLSTLLSDAASIDAKALGLLAANIAILIFIGQSTFNLAWWHWLLLVAPFFAALGYNAIALYPREYSSASVDLDVHPEYLEMDKETLVLQLLSDTENAIYINTKLNQKRWQACAYSFLGTLAGSLVLLITLGLK